MAAADTRARVLALLARYGHETTSFQILEPGLRYWFSDDGEACIAYAEAGRAWVVAGAPVAPHERHVELIGAFTAAAAAARRRVRFFGLEHDLSEETGFRFLHMGDQPFWDPAAWPATLRKKKSLREQLRRARAKGVLVRQVPAAELGEGSETRARIDAMIARWLDARAMAPMGFVVHLDPYSLPEERRFYVAQQGDRVVGILAAVPVYARDGWFFEDVLRDPEAPNGAMELLFDAAMRAAAEEGSPHVTYGLAPLANTEHRVLRWIRDHTRWLYHFGGLYQFKAKLMPTEWHPVYLAYPERERGIMATIDVLRAFARGSFVRFGLATLRHRAAMVTLILALLLIPWTALLAAVDTEVWFPSRSVQWGWIAYDALLFTGLVALASRWRPWLARLLAAAAAADAIVGTVQLAAYNAGRGHTVIEWLAVAAALVAPTFAAFFLWWSRDRPTLYRGPPGHAAGFS